MENGALWQACEPQISAQQVPMFESANQSCVPQSSFLSGWGTDEWLAPRADDLPDISLMSPSLVDSVTFSQVLNLPPVTGVLQDLVGGNAKFGHHGQWGPYDHFDRTPDMQDILVGQYVQSLHRSPMVTDQAQHKYSNLQGPSVFDKLLSTTPATSSQGPVMTAVQAPHYEGSAPITNPMGIFAPGLPCGSFSGTRVGGSESSMRLMQFPNQHHGNLPVPNTSRGASVPEMGPVDPLPTITGPSMLTFRQKNSTSGLMPPTHKPDVGTECLGMASFNPGPYVGCVVTTPEQQAGDASCGRRMYVDDTKNNNSPCSKTGSERRPQMDMDDARPAKADSVAMWPSLQMGGMSVCNRQAEVAEEKFSNMVQQPETGTLKRPLPSVPTSASVGTAANNARKRPLCIADSNHIQGRFQMKKPVQKLAGMEGCSRLEVISAAAHHKVSQSTASGRALGPALNTNLKPRARQGSANDPQSIAARVRRERISDRLKVLQALIPNGDKVDMVTMLEKAINYVQCLELQIRMLKDDSLWPKALGALPNTLQELLDLTGPEFAGGSKIETADGKTKNNKPVAMEEEQGVNSLLDTE